MKWFFRNIVAPVHFRLLDNGKWFKIEMLFLWMAVSTVIAIGRLAYSEQYFGLSKTLLDILICLPAIVGWLSIARSLFFRSIDELSDIDSRYWMTRLALSQKWWFRKSEEDLRLKKELEEKFFKKNGYYFSEMKYSKWTYLVVIVWILIAALIMILFAS